MWTPTFPSLYHLATAHSWVEDIIFIVTLNFYFCFDHTSHSTPNLISKIPNIFFRFPFLSFSRHLTLAKTPVGIHLLSPDTPLHFILLMYYFMTLSLIIFCSLCFIYSFVHSTNNYTSSPNPVSFSHLSGFVLSLKYFSYSL